MYYSIVADADIPRVQQSCGTAPLKPTQGKVLPTVHREITLAESERVRAELHSDGVPLLCQANECRGRVLEAAHYLCQPQLHELSCRVPWLHVGGEWLALLILSSIYLQRCINLPLSAHRKRSVRGSCSVSAAFVCDRTMEGHRSQRMRTSACRHFLLSSTFLMKRSGPRNELLNIM